MPSFNEETVKSLFKCKKIIAVFGANEKLIRKTERILNKSNKHIDFIFDNNFKLHETAVRGYPIKEFDFILKNCDKNDIAIVVENNIEKHFQLRSIGMTQNFHYFIIDDLIFPTDISSRYSRQVYAPWFADSEFQSTYAKMRKHTLVDITRCYELVTLLKQTKNLHGNVLEVGVWRGGTGFLLTHYAKQYGKTVYLADTFEGVVKTDMDKDFSYVDGMHSDTTLDIAKELFDYYNYDNKVFLKGLFPDDTSSIIDNETIIFCHIDVDVYQSAMQTTEWVWERMPVGGIIVYDDYGFPGCNGVTDYVNEASDIHSTDRQFLYNLNGHGIFIKTK